MVRVLVSLCVFECVCASVCVCVYVSVLVCMSTWLVYMHILCWPEQDLGVTFLVHCSLFYETSSLWPRTHSVTELADERATGICFSFSQCGVHHHIWILLYMGSGYYTQILTFARQAFKRLSCPPDSSDGLLRKDLVAEMQPSESQEKSINHKENWLESGT